MKRQIDPNLEGFGEDDILNTVNSASGFKLEELDDVLRIDGEASSAPAPQPQQTEEKGEYYELKEDVRSYHDAMAEAEKEKEEQRSHHHHHHHHRHHRHHSHHSSGHHHSSSSSSKSKKKKKSRLPTAIKVAIIILLVLLLALGTVFGTFMVLKSMGKKDIMPAVTEQTKYEEIIEYGGHKYKFNENMVALAFEGVDVRTLQTSAETDFVGASDADLVIAVDTETGKTTVIAIPRDTMVDVDMYSADTGLLLKSDKAQLCLAYAYGDGAELSCQNTVDAMSRILNNVPISKYFALDLDGIAPLNDAIGGVEISNSLYPFPQYGVSVGDPVTLKGDMAERYIRTRDMDNVEASLNRTERQIQYVKAYANQALPAVVRDFSTVSKLYNISKSYSRTNLTMSNATYMASLLLSKNIRTFDSVTLKGEMKTSPVPDEKYQDIVYAEFYPDEDFLMQTVLNTFYTQIE